MVKKCSACSASNNDDANFCSSCGTPFKAQIPQPTPTIKPVPSIGRIQPAPQFYPAPIKIPPPVYYPYLYYWHPPIFPYYYTHPAILWPVYPWPTAYYTG